MKAINPFKPVINHKVQYIDYDSHQPVMYKEFLVVYNPKGSYDVAKNGVCICQRVTQSGAKGFIDIILTKPNDYFVKRALGFLDQHSK